MIISASYKTDIPTFYGEWFMNRLEAGYCKTLNPYNQQITRVALTPESVDGFIFWTKNIGPFLKHLDKIQRRGFAFVVQHTINSYPRALEAAVVNAPLAIEYFKRVAETFGPRVCVWRYDTIVNSSITPRDFHLQTFSRIAKAVEGATDEVVISFAQMYRKTVRNIDHAANADGFSWSDPSDEWKLTLAKELCSLASSHGIRLTVCSQPQFVIPGLGEARCVDTARMQAISGKSNRACPKGNRKGCACYESKDIGEYDTCPHGCVYCYAVQNQSLAKARFKEHDPLGESLYPLPKSADKTSACADQLGLF